MINRTILKKINNLKNKTFKKPTEQIKVYLAGPMEKARDYGTGWRNEIEPILTAKGFDVFNPANEVKLFKEIQRLKKNQEVADLSKMKEHFEEIIFTDLNEVLESDVLLCHWPSITQMSAGTAGEMTVAKLFTIPVVLVTDDIETLPKWLLGCTTIIKDNFNNIEDSIRYLFNGGKALWQKEIKFDQRKDMTTVN